jgi:transposase
MKRFVQSDGRTQSILLRESLDNYLTEANPVRVVDVFVDEFDLAQLGFDCVEPAATGQPSYHPGVTLKIYTTRTVIPSKLWSVELSPVWHTPYI